jgi:hypothetical protein
VAVKIAGIDPPPGNSRWEAGRQWTLPLFPAFIHCWYLTGERFACRRLLDKNRPFLLLFDFILFIFTLRYYNYTLLYDTLLYSTLRYATLRYSTLLYATLRYSTLLYATLRYSTLLYATLCYSTLLYVSLRYSTPLYATLRYSKLLYATSRLAKIQLFVQFSKKKKLQTKKNPLFTAATLWFEFWYPIVFHSSLLGESFGRVFSLLFPSLIVTRRSRVINYQNKISIFTTQGNAFRTFWRVF